MPSIAIAMFAHEGNTFCPVPTDLAAFRAKVWLAGDEVADAFAGTASEMGAALAFLARHPDWTGSFLRVAATTPAGPLTRETFETIAAEIVEGLEASRWDAVYVALHGAMLAEHAPAADLEVMTRIRRAIGPDVPFGASFDLHANLDPGTVELVDVAAGYKTYPHVDQHATASRVLEALRRMVAGEIRPLGALAKLDAILPSIAMRTAEGPMAEMEAFAAGLEFGAGLIDASVFGGFSYGDTPSAGASVMVFADGDGALARRAADRLIEEYARRRDRFFISLPTPEEAVATALAAERFPVAITDPGDNPLSGGVADTPGLLRAVLAARPRVEALFAYFCDPALAAEAGRLGVGGRLAGTLGATRSPDYGAPVPLSATVVGLADGRFRGKGPMGTGVTVDFGPSALLRLDDLPVSVIVTSSCANLIDTGLFDAFGIDLAAVALLCVKAKNHFRAAFGPLMAAIIDCDAPGPAALAIERFPFRHAPRHLYPLTKGAAAGAGR